MVPGVALGQPRSTEFFGLERLFSLGLPSFGRGGGAAVSVALIAALCLALFEALS